MRIYLWVNEEEHGPFTRDEVFSLMKEGSVNSQTFARREEDSEWKTVDEILSKGSAGLLSVKDILEAQAAAPAPPPVFVPDFQPARLEEAEEPEPKKRMRPAIIAGVSAIVLLAAIVIFVSSRGGESPEVAEEQTPAPPVGEVLAVAGEPRESTPPAEPAVPEAPPARVEEDAGIKEMARAGEKAPGTPDAAPAVPDMPDTQIPDPKPIEVAANTTPSDPPPASPPELSEATAKAETQAQAGETVPETPPAPQPLKPADVAPAPSDVPRQPAVPATAAAKTPVKEEKSPSEEITEYKPFDTQELSEAELTELLRERFSSPAIRAAKKESPPAGEILESHSFVLETDMRFNPTVEVVYRLPVRDNKPGKNADNILMMGFWWGAVPTPVSEGLDAENVEKRRFLGVELEEFASRLGYTTFSLQFSVTPELLRDPEEAYHLGGKAWQDVVFRAQAEIAKRHKLKPRKLLMFGSSMGGEFVQKLAAGSPDKVAAVAVLSASDTATPQSASDTAWFLGITRGDAMKSSYTRLMSDLLKQGATFSLGVFPPNYDHRGGKYFYHMQSATSMDASRAFLRGVVERYDTSGNTDAARWLYVRNRAKPLRIFQKGSASANKIPPEMRELLPSKEFVQNLQVISAPLQRLRLEDENGKNLKCLVGVPPLGKPRGVLIYSHKYSYTDLSMAIDNIYYLAERGFLVIAPDSHKTDASFSENIVNFLKRNDVIGKLPLVCVGYGKEGNRLWDFLSTEQRLSPRALAMLEFNPGDVVDPSSLPPGSGIRCPAYFVYDQQPLLTISSAKGAASSLDKLKSIREMIQKCKEKNKSTGAIFVARGAQDLEARTWQLSIEHAARMLGNVLDGKTGENKFPDF